MNALDPGAPHGQALPNILTIDTAGPACQVVVASGGAILAARSVRMLRGHGEALIPMVEEVLGEAGLAYEQLDRIGVTIGPGSFTGMRVGLAAARGFSATLAIPVVGIGTLEALALSDVMESGIVARRCVAVDARNGLVYGQRFDTHNTPQEEPGVMEDLVFAASVVKGSRLVGPATPIIAALARAAAKPVTLGRTGDVATPVALAQMAFTKDVGDKPRPLYLKAADAVAAKPAGLRAPLEPRLGSKLVSGGGTKSGSSGT